MAKSHSNTGSRGPSSQGSGDKCSNVIGELSGLDSINCYLPLLLVGRGPAAEGAVCLELNHNSPA